MIVPGEYVLENPKTIDEPIDSADVPGLMEITDRYGTTRRVMFKQNEKHEIIKKDIEIEDLQRKVINEEIRMIQKVIFHQHIYIYIISSICIFCIYIYIIVLGT